MKNMNAKFIILLMMLSVGSMSAHGFVSHEVESCSTCILNSSERDLDKVDGDSGDSDVPVGFIVNNAIELVLNSSKDILYVTSNHFLKPQNHSPHLARGPPANS